MSSSTLLLTQGLSPTTSCEYTRCIRHWGQAQGVVMAAWLAVPGSTLVSSTGTSSAPIPWPTWPAAARARRAAAATSCRPATPRLEMRPSSEAVEPMRGPHRRKPCRHCQAGLAQERSHSSPQKRSSHSGDKHPAILEASRKQFFNLFFTNLYELCCVSLHRYTATRDWGLRPGRQPGRAERGLGSTLSPLALHGHAQAF